MLPIQYVGKFIKILRSAASPPQIAGGFVLGMILGFLPPAFNLITLFIVLLIIILNVNIATAIFAYTIFSLFSYVIDPLFHSLGFTLLVETSWLKSFWVTLYNLPIVPYSRFNNTVVLGSLTTALILLFPMYFLSKRFIITYREKYEPRVKNWKWVKYTKSTQIYQWYEKLKFMGE